MASHPYISGAGNITQMINQLRKNFPTTVTSETVKKYGLAPNNESYVINALQFIGVIDGEGKRTDRGSELFTIHSDQEFQKAFAAVVRESYKDLFDLHADEAWKLSKEDLIGYFRTSDKTSDAIGTRQASVFKSFAALAGHEDVGGNANGKGNAKSKEKAVRVPSKAKRVASATEVNRNEKPDVNVSKARDMSLTVRIEINLPAGGTRDTYDNIFQSIKANLLNE